MGTLSVPASGLVYLDANPVIYSVEKHPTLGPLVHPVWLAAQAKAIEVVSSELVLLETLVGPMKAGDKALADAYELLFVQPQTRLLPITQAVLREAARLRATTKLKAPDAIHAATAMIAGCALFLSNDDDFRGVPGLPVTILSDLLSP